jgi:hypothetical protein
MAIHPLPLGRAPALPSEAFWVLHVKVFLRRQTGSVENFMQVDETAPFKAQTLEE